MTNKNYDLTAMDNDDVSVPFVSDVTGTNATVYVRPCNTKVSNSKCAAVGDYSVCFDFGSVVAGAAVVGSLFPTLWTRPPPLNATFNYFFYDGIGSRPCLEAPGQNYQLSVNMFCDPAAPIPYDREESFVLKFQPCQYNISIYTPLVCQSTVVAPKPKPAPQ